MPTSSGKTFIAELRILAELSRTSNGRVIYLTHIDFWLDRLNSNYEGHCDGELFSARPRKWIRSLSRGGASIGATSSRGNHDAGTT